MGSDSYASNHLAIALMAARKAADVLIELFGQTLHQQSKGTIDSIVTTADINANNCICDVLAKHTTIPIFSEESEALRHKESEMCWIVDPLDGTTNYSRGIPCFAVSIALLVENTIQVAVVIDPIHKCEYTAIKGGGAFKNGSTLQIPKVSGSAKPVVFINNGYDESSQRSASKIFSRLATKVANRKLGATALELAFVASGLADGFIGEGDELWDYAAGLLLVSESGGIVSDWNGLPWSNKSSKIIACVADLHSLLIESTF